MLEYLNSISHIPVIFVVEMENLWLCCEVFTESKIHNWNEVFLENIHRNYY